MGKHDSKKAHHAAGEGDYHAEAEALGPKPKKIDSDTYFKELATDIGIPYQTLINSYLRDCAVSKRRPTMRWTGPSSAASPWTRRGRTRSS